MEHKKFHYHSLEEVFAEQKQVGVSFPLSGDTSVLNTPFAFGKVQIHNRMGIAPMEGADSNPDGSPSEKTFEHYIRLAKGGAGIIWLEAVAIVPEGRSSPHQLLLSRETLPAFQKLTMQVKEAGIKANGFAPYLIMQANHSGRYAKPDGVPRPIIAYRHPIYEQHRPTDDSCIATDDYLKSLEEKFGQAALLCREAGFDAVDIKSCHGYLLAELSSAYTRPGLYGGSFENRFRLFINACKNAKQAETDNFQVVARVGIYDGYEYPYGFGVRPESGLKPDYREAIRLMKILHEECGLQFVNITMGNPYEDTHVTRPYDLGNYLPPEHPFEGIARMYEGCAAVKKAVPGLMVSASAPSYLRVFSPNLAAGAILNGCCDEVLFGRLSFANPEFPNEIAAAGSIDPKKVCVTCGKCGVLIRAGKLTGCVVRMPHPYLDILRSINT